MKIGIMTFHRAKNYGAVLQAYALQKVLEKNNTDSEIIDYRDNVIENRYKFFKTKNLKQIIRDIIYYPILKKRYLKIEKFVKGKLKTSKKITTREDLKGMKHYDKYITGSDQVWNYKLIDEDNSYLLDFIDDSSKKYSYAASVGVDEIPEDKQKSYLQQLGKFKRISVRENKAKEILEKLIKNKDIRVDIDPTLLLDKEEWEKIAIKPKEKNYIVMYLMHKNKDTFKFAKKLAKKTNSKIIFIADTVKRKIKAKYKYSVSPEEWLGYFFNAKYVITNSFHGLAFSINMNKTFFVQMQNGKSTGNSRLEQLLKTFNLQDRKITNFYNDFEKKINWNDVNSTLKKYREDSIQYIEDICSEKIK